MMQRILLAGSLLVLPIVAVAAYPDVPTDHRSAVAINTLQSSGIMRGYPDGSFGPEVTLNRAELMKLLVESSGEQPDAEYYSECFPDVQREWFAPFVCYAAEQEWVSGYPDGTFQPGRPVNTAEALKMLVGSKGYAIAVPDSATGTAPFGTGAWFAPYISTAITEGIVDARAFRSVWPDSPLPRSRAAEFLYASMLQNGHAQAVLSGDDCIGSGMTTVTVRYNKAGDTTDTQLAGTYADGSTCRIAAQFNPYRTGTSGMDDLLSPLLLPDSRLIEADNTYTMPLSADGRAYFVHATFDPYLNADDGALWELRSGTGSITKLPFTIARPYLVSPDLHHVAFVRSIAGNMSRLEYADLTTGKRVSVREVPNPQSFFVYASSGSAVGGFAFGTGNTLTYGLYDSSKETTVEDGIVQYAKISEHTVDLSTLILQ
jgi:hypothetical protein